MKKLFLLAAMLLSHHANGDTVVDRFMRVSASATTATAYDSSTTAARGDTLKRTLQISTSRDFSGLVVTRRDTIVYAGPRTDGFAVTSTVEFYLRIITLSETGSLDTSDVLALKWPPTLTATVTPGVNSLTTVITVNAGGDSMVPVRCTVYLDSGHTSPYGYDTIYVSGPLTQTFTVVTPSVLAAETWYFPEATCTSSEGSVTADTAVSTLPYSTAPSADTSDVTTVGDRSITLHLQINTIGSSGYFVAKRYDSLGRVVDTIHGSLAATYGLQYLDVTFDSLQPNTRYGFDVEVFNPFGSTWLGHLDYVTLAQPPGLHLLLSAYEDLVSGDIIATTNVSIFAGSTCDFIVLLAADSISNVVYTYSHTETSNTVDIDAFEATAQSTYYVYAYGHDNLGNPVFSDTVKIVTAPASVQQQSVPAFTDAIITVTDIMGRTIDRYMAKDPSEIWRKDARYVPGQYVARGQTERGTFAVKKFLGN